MPKVSKETVAGEEIGVGTVWQQVGPPAQRGYARPQPQAAQVEERDAHAHREPGDRRDRTGEVERVAEEECQQGR